MTVVRSWKDVTPYVGHESAIIWSIFREKGAEGLSADEAPLEGFFSLTHHAMQGRKSGDYHLHEDMEQVYYITAGRGKMKIDDAIYEVAKGDAVHVPPMSRHQLINDGEEWIEHLIISARVNRS